MDLKLLEFFAKSLKEIVIESKQIFYRFSFDSMVGAGAGGAAAAASAAGGGGGTTGTLELPSVKIFLLESGNKEDPYLICPQNKVQESKSESAIFHIRDTVRFEYDQNGITRVFDGDIQVKRSISPLMNVSVVTQYKPNFPQPDFKTGKTLLLVSSSGKPSVKNNHYVPRSGNLWFVLSVAGMQVWIPAPHLMEKKKKKLPSAATTMTKKPSPLIVVTPPSSTL